MTKKTHSNILRLGWYQIIGGAIGILMIVFSLLSAISSIAPAIWAYAIMVLFFIYSIFCGVLCINIKTRALELSLTNQILQVLSFSFFGVTFSYVSGLSLIFGIDLSQGVNIHFNLGISSFRLFISNDTSTISVTFNILAIAIIYWIDKLKKKIRAEKEQEEIALIGETGEPGI